MIVNLASRPVTAFIEASDNQNAFLMLIGVTLVREGFDVHIPCGYFYFGMAFASVVEALNVLARRHRRFSAT